MSRKKLPPEQRSRLDRQEQNSHNAANYPSADQETATESQSRLAGIIDSAIDAIITINAQHRILVFNRAAEKMFLCSAAEAIGQPLDRFLPERFRPSHSSHIQGFSQTGVSSRAMAGARSVFGQRTNGEEFPIEASISQVETGGQKLFTVIMRDVTERERAEERFRQLIETLKEQTKILDLAPVLIQDLNARIVFWNTGAEQMYGWKAEEVLEKTSLSVFKTEFPRPVEEIKARLFARGHWEGELVHTRRDGEQIVVASHWVLHRDENNNPKAILQINNDITERRRAEQEVRRLNEELEQRVADRTAELQAANKELEAFSYSVSHDLRAPLRHINGFSQALLEDCNDLLDETGKEYLREVRSATQEMAQLIDDVLQLARVSRSELHREVVDLSDLAEKIIAKLKARDSTRQAKVVLEEGLTGAGDKRLLGIVLENLLGNAWKFTSKRTITKITLRGNLQDGEHVYSIEDNGAGFDMAFADKLFGTFQRLHRADEFEGTGIGLATVQRIIHRHGGRVWAEGSPEGAKFYFSLPTRKDVRHE
ncbi:MAG TPA: PAS domain S-box protein [Pyrinomonadaceae bacterium]|jgi:PAS domain S-box-containing protein|nr:PAS domain S-box protein [Pyrinomonadaceae bacterium]